MPDFFQIIADFESSFTLNYNFKSLTVKTSGILLLLLVASQFRLPFSTEAGDALLAVYASNTMALATAASALAMRQVLYTGGLVGWGGGVGWGGEGWSALPIRLRPPLCVVISQR